MVRCAVPPDLWPAVNRLTRSSPPTASSLGQTASAASPRPVARPRSTPAPSGRCCRGPHIIPGAACVAARSLQTCHRPHASSPLRKSARSCDWSHHQSSPSTPLWLDALQTNHGASHPFAPTPQNKLCAPATAGASAAVAAASTIPWLTASAAASRGPPPTLLAPDARPPTSAQNQDSAPDNDPVSAPALCPPCPDSRNAHAQDAPNLHPLGPDSVAIPAWPGGSSDLTTRLPPPNSPTWLLLASLSPTGAALSCSSINVFPLCAPLRGPPKGDIFIELARGHYHRVATSGKNLLAFPCNRCESPWKFTPMSPELTAHSSSRR